MKYKYWLILAVLLSLTFWGCKGQNKSRSGQMLEEENLDKDASYALGMMMGSTIASDGIFPNMEELIEGLKDTLTGQETRFSELEANMILQMAFMSMMEERENEAKQQETTFLAENSKKPGIIITASGLQYEVVVAGSGSKPGYTDVVKVHYEGRLPDGTIFDSSYMRDTPLELPLNAVIPGWTEGLQLMNTGGKYIFYIPSELAYGSSGTGGIPPYSPLIFEVELLEIIK